jgi:small subunit ribosomal protein S20
MPNTEGAKKRLRQSLVRRERNRAAKSALRGLLRKFREAIATQNIDEAKERKIATSRALDKAASKGFIHRNKASRLKSRLSHALKTAQTAKA